MKRFGLLLVLSVHLVSCTVQTGGERERGVITIAALKGPSGMGMVRLLERDSLAGMKLNARLYDEPLEVRATVLHGDADFAVVPTNMAAILYNKGADIQLLAVPVWGSLFLVGRGSDSLDWHSLVNRRVYMMGRGATPDILFRYMSVQNGLHPESDLQLDYSFPTHLELGNAMAAGIADLGVLPEPMVSVVLGLNPALSVKMDLNLEWIRLSGGDVPMAQTALIVRKGFARSHPEVVEAVAGAWEESTNWVRENPLEALALFVKHGIMVRLDGGTETITRSNLRYMPAGRVTREIENYLSVCLEFDPRTIGGRIPDEGFYYKK